MLKGQMPCQMLQYVNTHQYSPPPPVFSPPPPVHSPPPPTQSPPPPVQSPPPEYEEVILPPDFGSSYASPPPPIIAGY